MSDDDVKKFDEDFNSVERAFETTIALMRGNELRKMIATNIENLVNNKIQSGKN